MKKFTLVLLTLWFGVSNFALGQIDSVLVSDVQYKNAKFNNSHAGSAFLLNYKSKLYGCTAKHVLFFAKTENMNSISFNDELVSWNFQSKKEESKKVVAGKLLNENKNEALVMPPDGDWLIFEINGEVPPNIAIYTLREKPLKENEELWFLGYPYGNSAPIQVKGTFTGLTADNNLSLDVPKGNYGGCSGGPVIDKAGKLVGIVSMGYFNEKENKMIFEPASLDYFKTVMAQKNLPDSSSRGQ